MKRIYEYQYYTPKEISEILKISRRYVLQLLKRQDIKGVQVGRFWRISKKSFNRQFGTFEEVEK